MALKAYIVVPCNVVLGFLRMYVFLLTIMAILCAFLDDTGAELTLKSFNLDIDSGHGANGGDSLAKLLLQVWVYVRRVIETVVCLMVLADTVVTYDIQTGTHTDSCSFLQLLKIPKPISRAVLWLIVLSLPVARAQVFFLHHFNHSTTTTAIFILNSSRKVLVLPALVYFVFSSVRHWRRFVGRITDANDNAEDVDDDDKRWQLPRYYEGKQFEPQTVKQRVEKAIITIVCLLSLIGQLVKIMITVQEIPEANDALVSVSDSNGTLFQDQTIRKVIYIFDLVGSSSVRVLLTLTLLIYIFWFACRKSFLPIHSVVKVFHLYLFLSATPTDLELQFVLSSTFHAKAGLWIAGLMPLVFLFSQSVLYILSRKLYQIVQEAVMFFKSVVMRSITQMISRHKFSRCLQCISIILGTTGLILFVIGINLPWLQLDFHPNKNLKDVLDLHGNIGSVIADVVAAFDKLSFCDGNDVIQEAMDDIKAHSYCYNETSTDDENCTGSLNAMNSYDEYPNSGTCVDIDECLVYIPLMASAFLLMFVPFVGGTAAKVTMDGARLIKRLLKLRRKFMKLGRTFKAFFLALQNMRKFFKIPIATSLVSFRFEIHVIIVLLPSLLIGFTCISLGFWRRRIKSGAFLRNTCVLALLVLSNFACTCLVFHFPDILGKLLNSLPLIRVEIQHLIGWKILIASHVCSLSAAIILCILSFAQIPGQSSLDTCPKTEELELHDMTTKDNINRRSKTSKKPPKPTTQMKLPKDSLSARVWLMAFLPVVLGVLALPLFSRNADAIYKAQVAVSGETVELLDEIYSLGNWSVNSYASAMGEKSVCDYVTQSAFLVFQSIFSVLTDEITKQIGDFQRDLMTLFSFPEMFSISNNILIGLPLFVAAICFLFGLLVSLIPCPSKRKNWLLKQIASVIWILITTTLQLMLMYADMVSSLFRNIPMLDINVITGPILEYMLVCLVLLFLGYTELTIGGNMPLD